MEIYTTKVLFILTIFVASLLFYYMFLACSHMKKIIGLHIFLCQLPFFLVNLHRKEMHIERRY